MKKVELMNNSGIKRALILFWFVAGTLAVSAQSFKAFKMKPAKLYWGEYNIYFDGFTNSGDAEFDDCTKAFQEVFTKQYSWPNNMYNVVESKDEADIVVSGSYKFTPDEIMEIKEKLKTESGTRFPLKYTVNSYRQVNRVDFTLDIKVSDIAGKELESYQLNDSIVSKASSEVKLPRIGFSIEQLKEKMLKRTPNTIHNRYYIRKSEVWVKFMKVKIKDKALKEEFQLVKDYLNDGDFMAAGKIYKKIYESGKSPEAAFNTAMCYEFVGDYAKAAEFYKIKFDFASKLRMKENMNIWANVPEEYKSALKTF